MTAFVVDISMRAHESFYCFLPHKGEQEEELVESNIHLTEHHVSSSTLPCLALHYSAKVLLKEKFCKYSSTNHIACLAASTQHSNAWLLIRIFINLCWHIFGYKMRTWPQEVTRLWYKNPARHQLFCMTLSPRKLQWTLSEQYNMAKGSSASSRYVLEHLQNFTLRIDTAQYPFSCSYEVSCLDNII